MISVRMGEIAVSAKAGCELLALGLGSCIGLAMVDRTAGVAGLAHIVLPESRGEGQAAGKYADRAVPELLSRMRAEGALVPRLEVAIAGGARMFALEAGMDVGARNEEAVREELERAGLQVNATHTGGDQGRTLKIYVGQGLVTVRIAGTAPVALLGSRSASGRSAALPLTTVLGLIGGSS